MAISGVWKKDKTSSLSSWEDYSLYFFDKMEYVDRLKTIPATFPNFRTGELVSNGHLELDDYDPLEAISDFNYDTLFYYNEGLDRLKFKISLSTTSGQYDEAAPVEMLEGNILGQGSVISLVVNDSPDHPLTRDYIIHSSTMVGFLGYNQIFGEVILMNDRDHEDGYKYIENDFEAPFGQLQATWSCTLPAWTESDITINKADFWGRDTFGPDV